MQFFYRLSTALFLPLYLFVATSAATAAADHPLQLSPALSKAREKAPDVDAASTLSLVPLPSEEIRDELPSMPTIDLTTPADDVWQRMRNGFSMPDLDSPLVANRQAWYLNRPDLLERVFERSRRYLYHIVVELEKRGMPTELALLPVVESSFNPTANSSARALGMWQFIPSTGKQYKLQQNAWFDQRRDVVASTNAALDYLQRIYERHGDWHLALASYNWGEGSVGKAISKNIAKGLPTDYLHLTMPDETRYYVPKLQAIKNIIAQPELFGIRLDPIPNQPYFSSVERRGNMDVALAARLAEIPIDEFIALNPAYSRPVMPSASKNPLALPTDKVQTYLNNLQRHEAQDKPLSSWLTHTLKKGERIDAVAIRYGVNPIRLKQMNGINPRTRLAPGFTLLVPGKGAAGYDALASKLPRTVYQTPQASTGKPIRNGSTAKSGKKKLSLIKPKVRKSRAKSATSFKIKPPQRPVAKSNMKRSKD